MPTNTGAPYAAVYCRLHGTVDIDKDEYIRQMNKPNSLWVCPICKSVSMFNDERFEELNPQPED